MRRPTCALQPARHTSRSSHAGRIEQRACVNACRPQPSASCPVAAPVVRPAAPRAPPPPVASPHSIRVAWRRRAAHIQHRGRHSRRDDAPTASARRGRGSWIEPVRALVGVRVPRAWTSRFLPSLGPRPRSRPLLPRRSKATPMGSTARQLPKPSLRMITAVPANRRPFPFTLAVRLQPVEFGRVLTRRRRAGRPIWHGKCLRQTTRPPGRWVEASRPALGAELTGSASR
jgi:hypothetical protein